VVVVVDSNAVVVDVSPAPLEVVVAAATVVDDAGERLAGDAGGAVSATGSPEPLQAATTRLNSNNPFLILVRIGRTLRCGKLLRRRHDAKR
jgi:hypothetical protein